MGAVVKSEKQRERRQYGSGSIYQRGDGMWVGRIDRGYDRNGKRDQVYVYATTEPRAKEKLEAKKVDLARGLVPAKGVRNKMTVAAWAEEWLKIAVAELGPSSYSTAESAVRKWIVGTIGRRRLNQLGPGDFRAIYSAQRAVGRKPATLIRTHAVLSKMLKDAVREGHDVPQAALLARRPDAGETDREAIEFADAMALLETVSQRPDASLWAALFLQGLRKGEALGLTWSCVDFENDRMRIDWQLQNLPYIDRRNKHLGFRVPDGYVARHLVHSFNLVRPKTKTSRRVIPMVPWMKAALLAWREVATPNEYDLVWPDAEGMPQKSDEYRAEWKALQKLADVAHPIGRPYHLHEALHATATILLELGVPKETVAEILGHSKFIDAYDHSSKLPRIQAALEQLAEKLALTA